MQVEADFDDAQDSAQEDAQDDAPQDVAPIDAHVNAQDVETQQLQDDAPQDVAWWTSVGFCDHAPLRPGAPGMR